MSLGVKKKYNHTNKKIYIKYVKYLYLFLNYKKIPIQSSFNSQIKTWPKLDLKRKKKLENTVNRLSTLNVRAILSVPDSTAF